MGSGREVLHFAPTAGELNEVLRLTAGAIRDEPSFVQDVNLPVQNTTFRATCNYMFW